MAIVTACEDLVTIEEAIDILRPLAMAGDSAAINMLNAAESEKQALILECHEQELESQEDGLQGAALSRLKTRERAIERRERELGIHGGTFFTKNIALLEELGPLKDQLLEQLREELLSEINKLKTQEEKEYSRLKKK